MVRARNNPILPTRNTNGEVDGSNDKEEVPVLENKSVSSILLTFLGLCVYVAFLICVFATYSHNIKHNEHMTDEEIAKHAQLAGTFFFFSLSLWMCSFSLRRKLIVPKKNHTPKTKTCLAHYVDFLP